MGAVENGLLPPLLSFGFAAREVASSQRGETVECGNGVALIAVSADWLEGELSVTVQQVGAPAVPVEDLVEIKALHLTRIGRGTSPNVVEATLRKIAEALTTQVPEAITPA